MHVGNEMYGARRLTRKPPRPPRARQPRRRAPARARARRERLKAALPYHPLAARVATERRKIAPKMSLWSD